MTDCVENVVEGNLVCMHVFCQTWNYAVFLVCEATQSTQVGLILWCLGSISPALLAWRAMRRTPAKRPTMPWSTTSAFSVMPCTKTVCKATQPWVVTTASRITSLQSATTFSITVLTNTCTTVRMTIPRPAGYLTVKSSPRFLGYQ